jgi:hypothetical protein
MRLTKLFSIVLLIFVVLFANRCNKEGGYYNPPSEIFNLKITNGDKKVSFTWADPRNYDFEKIKITCLGTSVEVPKGVQYFELNNLTNDSVYPVLVQTLNYRGDISEGVEFNGRPRGLPAIEWIGEPEHALEYSIHGYPNGYFHTERSFRNNGSWGYITFCVRLIDLNTHDTIEEIIKDFLVEHKQVYTLYFRGKGDMTLINCAECKLDSTSRRIEYSLEDGLDMFYYEPPACQLIQECANGNDKRALRWNSIGDKEFYIAKKTKQ